MNPSQEANNEELSVILSITDPATLQKLESIQSLLDKKFPGLHDFKDEFHVTLAQANGMTQEEIDTVVPTLKKILRNHHFDISLGPIDTFDNPEHGGILQVGVHDREIENLAKQLRDVIEEHGGKFKFPDFKGHVTLAYRDDIFSPEEKEELMTVMRRPIPVSTSDIRVTQKTDNGWERLANVHIHSQPMSKRQRRFSSAFAS